MFEDKQGAERLLHINPDKKPLLRDKSHLLAFKLVLSFWAFVTVNFNC